jgi:hypothetical protein
MRAVQAAYPNGLFEIANSARFRTVLTTGL